MSNPYTDLIDQAEAVYQARLANTASTNRQIIDASYKVQLMKASYAAMTTSIDPAVWNESMKAQLQYDLHYEEVSADNMNSYKKKMKQLQDIIDGLKRGDPSIIKKAWGSDSSSTPDWFPQRSPEFRRALNVMATDFQDWITNQRVTPQLLSDAGEVTFKRFTLERPVSFILVRLSQKMKWDSGKAIRRSPGFVTEAQQIDKTLAHAKRVRNGDWPPGMTDPEIFLLIVGKPAPGSVALAGGNQESTVPVALNSDQRMNQLAGSPGGASEPDTDRLDELALGDPPGYKVPDRPTPLLPDEEVGYLKPKGTEQPMSIIASEMAFTTALMFIPGASQVYSVGEILTGYNIFGYPLTDQDRIILAACIAVPMAGKYAKLGLKGGAAVAKASQTATEAEKLIISAEHGTETIANISPKKVAEAAKSAEAVFEVSGKAVRLGSAGQEVLFDALRKIIIKEALSPDQEAAVLKVITSLVEASPGVFHEITEEGLKALAAIIAKYPVLALLDSQAWLRILRGVKWRNIMGRVFEELWNAKVKNFAVHELEQLFGAKIPGLVWKDGSQIADTLGQEISDGLFCVVKKGINGGKGKVFIYGVAELKSGATVEGQVALKGISRTFEQTIKNMEKKELAAFENRAADEWAKFVKESAGKEPSMSKAEFVKDFWTKEQIPKSQVEQVFQRLTEGDARTLKIEGELYDVVLDDSIRWFAVIPSDGGKLMKGYVLAQTVLARKGYSLIPWPLSYVTTVMLKEIALALEAIITIMRP